MNRILILYFFFFLFSANVVPASQSGQAGPFSKGLTALKNNQYADALEWFTAAEREHPDDPRVHNFLGITLARLGQNAKAAAEYQESIRLDPRMEDAYRNLGFLAWTEHQFDLAREVLEHAIELAPGDSFAHYYLGRVQLDSQQYPQALQELETSRVPLPTDVPFSIQLATGYVALGRQDDAGKALDGLVHQPLDDRQSIEVASLLLAIHRNDNAIMVIEQLSRDPSAADSGWLKFDLALVNLLAGSDEKAVEQAHAYAESLSQGSTRSVELAKAWSLAGIAHAHLKHGEQSVDALRQAAALAPGEEEHWLNLTRELMELNRYPEAIRAVQNGLAANPKSYALHLRLGAAQLAAGHYGEAENVFRDLIAAGDPLPTSYVGLAQVLLRTGRAGEAATELGQAEHKLGPNFLISYFWGLALARTGKTAEAISAFQAAARMDSNSAEVHLNLGKTELAIGRVSEAIAELQEVLRLTPGDAQASRLLSQAYRRAGDSKNAAKFAEASAENAPPVPEGDILGDFFLPHWQGPSGKPRP